jgi:polar amino acid transport system ATP-binding protein
MSPALIQARGLHKAFGQLEVLKNVDFSVARGEKVCLLGPSGSGKTTLLRCLNLLVEPTRGQLHFADELVGSWPAARGSAVKVDVKEHRSHIGMVFQHFELFPHLTALENIALGPRHVLGWPKEKAERRARDLLGRVGLAEKASSHPATLSGGQQQRVAIARALAMEPALILFDEPTSALDPEMVGEVLQLMSSLARDGMTMAIVTHELEFARHVADRIVVMEKGQIIEEGPADQVFTKPAHPRTKAILDVRLHRGVLRE